MGRMPSASYRVVLAALVAALAAASGCGGARRALPPGGIVVVRAFALPDSAPLRMVSAQVRRPGDGAEGPPLAARRRDGANEAALGPLPPGRAVVYVHSVGFDSQAVPVAVRAGCTDTVTVLLPPSPASLFPVAPRPGRWWVRGCPRGV